MKTKIAILCLLFFLLIFVACDSSGFFRAERQRLSLAVETLENGRSLSTNDEIPLIIHSERLETDPSSVKVLMHNSESQTVNEYVLEGEDLDIANLPTIALDDLELTSDIYSLNVELFQGESLLAAHDSWFFYTEETITLDYVTINPHSARVDKPVEITAFLRLLEQEPRSPYVQLRVNGELVQETVLDENRARFDIQSPSEPGIYDVRLDIYPWFDGRINETMESSNKHSIELLVLPKTTPSNALEERQLFVSDNIVIEENLLYYDNEKLAFTINMEDIALTSLESTFFEIADAQFMMALSRDGPNLGLQIYRNDTQYEHSIRLRDGAITQNIRITCLEGENNYTLVVFQNERFLFGDIIPFKRFFKRSSPAQLVRGGAIQEPIQGVRGYNLRSGDIGISPIQPQQESLFKQILAARHGNFLLYAEGFEFSLPEESEYSDATHLRGGYFVLPPGGWIRLPSFSLDEHTVNLETAFHPDDNLKSLNIILTHFDAGEHVFTLSGNGDVKVDKEVRLKDIALDTSLELVLNRQDNRLLIEIEDQSLNLADNRNGMFALYLSNEKSSKTSIRLDSVSATNKAEEFVNRVLDTLQ